MTSALVTVFGTVCALVGVWGLWMRRAGAPGADAIRVVTNRYLGGKRFLTLVEVDGERLLLGVAGEQVSLVARLGHAEPAPEQPGA
ncbi:MAG TPA: flagellar biosynthetic protein FliO [Candidatus Eisenbacteria bacterium]|nr:flagellar biosynthetic protein FliO [Candidatus Eisenbacteria bacterium]